MFDSQSLPQHAYNLGFWFVDNEIFFNKSSAILHATNKNTHDIRYYYWDHVYSLCDWTVEPQQSLQELYIERAKQLRQQYDYVVLLYSGGSDSSNALKSFIYNNIPLDEVCYWYCSNDENNEINLEIKYAAADMLQKCRDIGIKVTGLDEVGYATKHKLKKYEWVLDYDPILYLNTTYREQMIYENPDWLQLRDSGKSVAVVIGFEKPRIFYDGERWQFAFMDLIGYNYEKYHLLPPPVALEPFYISPNSPFIPIKQSHVLKRYITQNYSPEEYAKYFTHRATFNKDLYQKIVRNVVYPYWNDSTYSIGKCKSAIFSKKTEWIWNSNTDYSANYFSGFEWMNEKVEDYFLNDGNIYNGIKGTWSRWYCLDA